jgi:hypothetical protein
VTPVTIPEWLCWAVVAQVVLTVLAGGIVVWRFGRLEEAVDRLAARRPGPPENEGW